MDRREVGVLGTGKMMGPALYRNALELLLLDRVFLEEYFGDRVSLEARYKRLSAQCYSDKYLFPPGFRNTGTGASA